MLIQIKSFKNARSLAKKWIELELLLFEGHFDLIGISETWLEAAHHWAANIEGVYSILERQNLHKNWRGMCM